jgi:hypothetical protein
MMLPIPALARTGKRRDTLEELDEKHGVHISQLWIIDYMRIWERLICQDVALGALREMLPRIRLPDGYDQWQHPRILAFNSGILSQDLAFLVGACDETSLSSFRSVVKPLDIYKGQWSKISKIKKVIKAYLAHRERLGSLEVDS